ncbi:hypothetical protein niasHT_014787 [Heterodera trifolii]|uniref:Uncharacterized protein n=1 Tax=Heterodera trifolii TaxID=157864 RepID=A0ABD2L6I2_9BILA
MLDPYKQQPHLFLPHPNHYDHPDQHRNRQRTHRQHRSAAVAGRRAVGPLMPPPPPQRMPSPNCCSSSAATSSVVSEPISLDMATEQHFGNFERRRQKRLDWYVRRYSTSDLATSDSELARLGTGNTQLRRWSRPGVCSTRSTRPCVLAHSDAFKPIRSEQFYL